MKYVDEFRQPDVIRQQLQSLRQLVSQRWVIMDVCGGQTHAFLRYGLESALDDVLELIHGPGCPVCVTPAEVIDEAVSLAKDKRVLLATFGDMLRVPCGNGSLLQARTDGADVRMVYSPLDAVHLAVKHPQKMVVFFAVGFETTAPATALAILQARHLQLSNFCVLAHHVRVEPAMRAILCQPDCRVQGFLAAGHVCTVTGFSRYEELVRQFRVPIVVTGFEPVDLLAGLTECVRQLEAQTSLLSNQYTRSVCPEGSRPAQQLIENVFQVCTIPWRGFGEICNGGLVLQPEFQFYDVRQRFDVPQVHEVPAHDCRSAEVLSGQIKPAQCALFGTTCTPEHPLGAPMVSSEGACAAYFHYSPSSETFRE